MEEVKAGRFLSQEQSEEIFDEELKKLMGNHYQDVSAADDEYQPLTLTAPEEETGVRWDRVRALGGLIAGVGLLFYMILGGKIDTAYGVLFTAGVSAVCGYHMN